MHLLSLVCAVLAQTQNTIAEWKSGGILRLDQSLTSNYDGAPMFFNFAQYGDIAIQIAGERGPLYLGKQHLVDAGSGTSAQLTLTNAGELLLQISDENGNTNTKNLIPSTTSGVGNDNGPFYARVDYDRTFRIRNNQDEIVWQFPEPRTRVDRLESYRLNFLRRKERLVSPNGQWYITLNRRGQILNQNNVALNAKPFDEDAPHVLVLGGSGSLNLFDAFQHEVKVKGFPATTDEKGRYTAAVTDEGFLTVYNQNGEATWQYDLKPPAPPSEPTLVFIRLGRGKVAKGCDTVPHDYEEPLSSLEDCPRLCLDSPQCHHFVWNNWRGGTCFLKSEHFDIKNVIRSNDGDIHCGYVDTYDWAKDGSLFSASNCDFKGNDIGYKLSSRFECPSLCFNDLKCNHFTWTNFEGGTCYMKHDNKLPFADAIPYEGALCGGFVNKL